MVKDGHSYVNNIIVVLWRTHKTYNWPNVWDGERLGQVGPRVYGPRYDTAHCWLGLHVLDGVRDFRFRATDIHRALASEDVPK